MDVWMGKWVGGWLDVWMDKWMGDWCMNRWMDVKGWVDDAYRARIHPLAIDDISGILHM